ncbi:hypothetical protein TNCV_1666811 [Trichonephila clavipes]|nr:hypothetical protein TNCV_1666811 [Trichonephila clavipes]
MIKLRCWSERKQILERRTRRITQEIPGKRFDNTRRTGKSGDRCNEWRHQHSRRVEAGRDVRYYSNSGKKTGSDIRERQMQAEISGSGLATAG